MLFARIGDSVIGTCVCTPYPYPDVGVISTGDATHLDTGMAVAGVGNIAVFSCGSAVITTGTATDLTCGIMVARTGDAVSGCATGTIVSSSTHITI